MNPTTTSLAASATESHMSLAILLVIGLALFIPVVVLVLNQLLAPSTPNAVKLSQYESGLPATAGSARGRFAIKFYLIAILFVLFDVEAVFMYPWAVNFRQLGTQGFLEMCLFLGVLFAGYIYVVKRGALDWD
jgi:NADH-quinone oxidoreductase subunit A